MDSLLKTLREAKTEASFSGTVDEFKKSGKILQYCKKNNVIVKISPQDLKKDMRLEYTDFLVALTKTYLKKKAKVKTWEDFKKQSDTRKVQKMLFEYGVKAEVFKDESIIEKPKKDRSKTSLTLRELYEMCQIQFHFEGTYLSFKRHIQRQYGSFAEYCIMKGYDINSSKWEDDATAIRVASKIGSLENVKNKSKSLYNYLVENDLVDDAFSKNAA